MALLINLLPQHINCFVGHKLPGFVLFKTTDYYPTKTTALLSHHLGGQFEMAEGGQFHLGGRGSIYLGFPTEHRIHFKNKINDDPVFSQKKPI